MFEALSLQPEDRLLAVTKAFRADPRPHKKDLGVGVYRDAAGDTPVMQAVKAAERLLHDEQTSKTYVGPEGDLAYVEALSSLIFGGEFGHEICGVQTPGGGGALRLALDLVRSANPGARVWIGTPTWPNHGPIVRAVGLEIVEYQYFDSGRQVLTFDAMMDALSRASAGDVVLLHGCCHNPSGADPGAEQWRSIVGMVAERGLVPLVDLAYHGLGFGLGRDAGPTRDIVRVADEALIAYSCSKNFGLYRERTGALFVHARSAAAREGAFTNLLSLARANWSMPSDHGAALVRLILSRTDLFDRWTGELTAMRERITRVRQAVARCDPRIAFVASQNGMFSNLPLSAGQVEAMRARHGMYLAPSGRINLAGLREDDAEAFVAALSDCDGCMG